MNDMARAIHAAALGPPRVVGNEATGAFFFDPGFLGFEGHFPGYPLCRRFEAALSVGQGLAASFRLGFSEDGA